MNDILLYIPQMIAIIICVALSAFFSASEMTFSSANKLRLENAAEAGSSSARMALRIMEKFDNTLSAILVGNNLVNIATSSLGSLIVVKLMGESWTWISTVVLTVAVIIFGETIPKIIAKKNANRLAQILCYPIRFLTIVLFPVTLVVVGLVNLIMLILPKPCECRDEDEAQQELQSIIETAEEEEVLDEERSELLQAALEFEDVSVMSVMTARVDISAIDIEDSWDEIMNIADASPYSRLPVYEGSIDNVIGVLYLNRLYRHLAVEEQVDLRSILNPTVYLYKTQKLPVAMNELQAAKQHVAVVVDEYGGTLGIVTIEDIMEQLVGDIWDENDIVEEEEVVEHASGIYELDGDMQMDDFLELLKWREEDVDAESVTVGGWTIERYGTFPMAGQGFTFRNIEVKVLEMDGLRVGRVMVEIKEIPEEE